MRYEPNTPGSGSVVEDGEHQFEITDAEEKTSNTSGNSMLELVLKIKDGPTVYDYLVCTPDAFWKIDNFRASIGEDVRPGAPVDIDPDKLIGRCGTCILYTDTYQGRKKNKVADYVFVVSGPGSQPPAKDKWR